RRFVRFVRFGRPTPGPPRRGAPSDRRPGSLDRTAGPLPGAPGPLPWGGAPGRRGAGGVLAAFASHGAVWRSMSLCPRAGRGRGLAPLASTSSSRLLFSLFASLRARVVRARLAVFARVLALVVASR